MPADDKEYRISLIRFEGETVNIRTWGTDEARYALLDAALGDPQVDSLYSREYIEETAEATLAEGVHVVKDDEDDEGGARG